MGVYLDGIVTLVDARHALSTLGASEATCNSPEASALGLGIESAKQVACADIIIVNKTDLTDESQRKTIVERLGLMNPVAKLLESQYAAVSLASILGIKAFDRGRVANSFAQLRLNDQDDGHAAPGHGDGHDEGGH